MTPAKAIELLKEQQLCDDDAASAHIKADAILCSLLIDLGCEAVVKEWEEVKKWYS